MANFSHPMSLENPYISVDPFRPSIDFSLKNIVTTSRHQGQTTIDNIPLPPLSQRYRYMQAPGSVLPRHSRRAPSSSYYYSPAPPTISEKSSSPPPVRNSRNTFGIETTGARDERSHSRAPTTMPSPRPSDLRSSSPPPIDESTHHDTESHIIVPNPGRSSVRSHRRSNRQSRAEAKSSRDPEITLENRDSRHSPAYDVPPRSSNAISYYKPPTRSSEAALPSSSPYLASYLPPPIPDLNPAIKHEYPIPFTHPTSQPPHHHHHHHHHHSANLAICILAFLLDTLPRQIYLHLMLRLPHLYFSHVIHIFEDAEMSLPEIKQMALEANNHLKDPTTDISKTLYLESGFTHTNPRYDNLSRSWGAFIDSLMKEWKILNIISVLLLSAILTILQIQSAANDPVTRFAALLSMICALMSLLYGCIYIIRFGTMRSTYKAVEWAHEAQKTTTGIFWNVWVLLAMPATWLAWAMILFIIAIMAFVWRTGTINDANQTPITSHDALVPRIVVTVVLSIGLVYLILIAGTFRRYGTAMDRAWRNRVLAWTHEKIVNHGYTHLDPRSRGYQESVPPNSKPPMSPERHPIHYSSQHHPRNASPLTPPVVVSSSGQVFPRGERPRGRSTSVKPISTFVAAENQHRRPPASQKRKKIKPTKILGLCADDHSANVTPPKETLASCQMTVDYWERLSSELCASWDPNHLPSIKSILQRWNQTFFNQHGAQIVLCEEFGVPWLKHAIYHFTCAQDELPMVTDRYYDPIPPNLTGLDLRTL